VKLFVGGRLVIDEAQKLQPFLMAMTLHASGHHTANNVVVPWRL
jgi:hypothetical protein